MQLQDFLSRLKGVRPGAGGEYLGRCPAHDDRTASLCVSAGDKGIVLKCQAGCDTKSVVEAMGLSMRDLFWEPRGQADAAPGKKAGRGRKAAPRAAEAVAEAEDGDSGTREAQAPKRHMSYEQAYGYLGHVDKVYPYTDAEGVVLYEVVRIRQKDGKTFRQHHRLSADRAFPFIKGLPKGVRLVLYRLPDVLAAIKDGRTVYVVEGEKDCDNLWALGHAATTAVMGAGKWKNGKYGDSLAGADVCIIPDNDEKGLEHAQAVARDLLDKAKSVKVLDLKAAWPGLPDKGDVSDLYQMAGREAADEILQRLTAETPVMAIDPVERERLAAASAYERVNGYCVDQGRICQMTQDGPKALANFVALPRAVVERDDGVNIAKDMLLDGWAADGRPLPQVQIKASQFATMGWVAEKWDFAANIMPGSTVRDKLRYVISEVGNHLAKRVKEYCHTGWRRINGRWVYLYQGGAIGADDVTVELGSGLAGYQLTAGTALAGDVAPVDAGMHSLMVRDIMSEHIGIPVMAMMYLAPLREFLSMTGVAPAHALFLLGGTGTRKSTALALALSHYGDFNAKSLPASFSDTANYIRKKAFLLKDAPIVVDDYHPVTSLQERKKMEATAQSLARAFGDGAERGRMRSDLSLQESMPPRGIAIISGEDTPGVGESGMARFYVVAVGKEDIPANELLTAMQEAARRGYLTTAMRGYINWLRGQVDELADDLHEAFILNRAKALGKTKGQHGRTAEAIAHMMIGYDYMLRYMVFLGVLDEDEAEKQSEHAWQVLCENSKKQSDDMREERPGKVYLSTLAELINAKRVQVREVSVPAEAAPMMPNMIGYRDEQFYYLMPTVAFSAVTRVCAEQGVAFPLTQKMLYKQMREDNILTADIMAGGSATRPKWVDGRSQRLLWIRRELLDGPDGQRQTRIEDFTPVDDPDNPFAAGLFSDETGAE